LIILHDDAHLRAHRLHAERSDRIAVDQNFAGRRRKQAKHQF